MKVISKLLIDLDGVLFVGDWLIPGAIETLQYLEKNNYEYILLTNITRMSKQKILQKLNGMGIFVDSERIMSAPSATVDYINSRKKNAKCYLLSPKETDEDFKGSGIIITRKEEPVDFVIVGYDTNINYESLNIAFRLIQNGAEIVGMHEDKIFPGKPKNNIGLGPFVKCLEFGTSKRAQIIGKPNRNFFELGIKKMSATTNETAIIGDSLIQDIIGAKNAGLKTIMVKTGGYDEYELETSSIKPDYLINSIKDLPELLKYVNNN